MVFGMAMYGKTYTLADPANHDIGAPTIGSGNPGQFTQEGVRIPPFEPLNLLIETYIFSIIPIPIPITKLSFNPILISVIIYIFYFSESMHFFRE